MPILVPQLLSRMGVPKRLYETLTIGTTELVAEELFPAVEPFVMVTKDNVGTALIESASHLPVHPDIVLGAIDNALPDAELARVMAVKDDCYARLEVIGAQEEAVVPGDLVRAGVMVNFSPIGTIEPAVQGLTRAYTNDSID